jgi:hypothetical protein
MNRQASILQMAIKASELQEQNSQTLRVASRWVEKQGALRKWAFRQRKFLTLMNLGKGRTFGILSAYGPFPKHQNQIRHGELLGKLQKMGYKPVPLKGQWEGVGEKSVFVPNITPTDLFNLGEEYKQDSVIYKSKDGVVGMYYLKGHYAEVAIDPSLNPALDLDQGKDLYSKSRGWSFEFGFLWGQQIPWDGTHPISQKTVSALVANGQLSVLPS